MPTVRLHLTRLVATTTVLFAALSSSVANARTLAALAIFSPPSLAASRDAPQPAAPQPAAPQPAAPQPAAPQPAAPQPADNNETGEAPRDEVSALKRLYDEAHVAFLAGRFVDAAALFDQGYGRSRLTAFLFNGAVAWERAERLDQAIERYAQYLVASPEATDHTQIAERLGQLRKARAGRRATVTQVRTKGVAIITTKPKGAELRLDDPNGPIFAIAPFRGTLPSGQHVVHVSSRGYKPENRVFPDNDGKVLIGHFALSEEYFLGHLEIKSTLAGADVYLQQLADQNGEPLQTPRKVEVRGGAGTGVPIGKTPFSNQLPPGTWQVRVEKLGYTPIRMEVEIPQGKVELIQLDPKLIPTGILRLRAKTPASVGATAYLKDGGDRPLCTLPCETHIEPGEHTIVLKKAKKKKLEFDVNISRADMVTVDVSLEPATRRVPAIVTGVMMAGAGAVGTLFALRADRTRQAIENDLLNFVQIDADDPRATDGAIEAYVADACFLGAAVFGSLTLYYALRQTGDASHGEKHQRSLAARTTLAPVIGTRTLGIAGQVRF
ncbi:MAG: PEGA domain-containing protein [Nannocystaceae bacterium]